MRGLLNFKLQQAVAANRRLIKPRSVGNSIQAGIALRGYHQIMDRLPKTRNRKTGKWACGLQKIYVEQRSVKARRRVVRAYPIGMLLALKAVFPGRDLKTL